MDEVTNITETIKANASKSRVRRTIKVAVAALVGAAALSVVAKKVSSSGNTEQA